MTFTRLLSVAVLAASAAGAYAAPITPVFDRFGNLDAATFGGSGIPNDAVAVSERDLGFFGQVTLGLTAHQRYDAPALTHDGNGTFYALAGVSDHDPSPGDPYALWNVGFYASGATSYRLSYDFDPAAGNDKSTHGSVLFFGGENSYNLGMNFLDTGFPGLVTPPTFASFDPLAIGEYTFDLTAYGMFGSQLARTAIKVVVAGAPSQVPEPASLALAGIALIGLAASRRRKG